MAAKGVTLQVLSSVAGVGLASAIILFYRSQKKKGVIQNPIGDGSDPNFPGGKPIKPSGPVDTNDFTRPSCQIFNWQQNLFENAGQPSWDLNSDTCFKDAPQGATMRYVSADGTLSWPNSDDPLADDPAEAGTCFFYDGQSTYTFPDFGGYTPVNRSQRLCFSSAMSQSQVGMYFQRSSDGALFWNPNVDFGKYGNLVLSTPRGIWNLNGDQAWTAFDQEQGNRCEQRWDMREIPSNQGAPDFNGTSMQVWASVPGDQSKNTAPTCATDDQHRFWDVTNQKIIYFDPNSQKLVETPMLGMH